MSRAGIRFALIVAASAALVGGCGDDGNQNETARQAAEAYVKARNQGDAGKVCELYSDELRQRLGASNCEAFVKEQTAGVTTSFTLVGVKESGDEATATLRATVLGQAGEGGQLQISLRRQDGEWKVTALGGRRSD